MVHLAAVSLEHRHKRKREKKQARIASVMPRESITPSMDMEDMTSMTSSGAGNHLSLASPFALIASR